MGKERDNEFFSLVFIISSYTTSQIKPVVYSSYKTSQVKYQGHSFIEIQK